MTQDRRAITVGAFADTHYALRPSDERRFFNKSLAKLNDIVARFSKYDLDLIVCLGDLIDCRTDGGSAKPQFEQMAAALKGSGTPFALCLGNHDVSALTRREISAVTGLDPRGYCSFDLKGWHILLLDTNHAPDGSAYTGCTMAWDNCYIDPGQLRWLREDLAATPLPCLVFSHGNLDPRFRDGVLDPHVIKNHREVRAVLEESGKVKLVVQGHCHEGYESRIRGIPYLTLRAVVEGSDANYALVIRLDDTGVDMEQLF